MVDTIAPKIQLQYQKAVMEVAYKVLNRVPRFTTNMIRETKPVVIKHDLFAIEITSLPAPGR